MTMKSPTTKTKAKSSTAAVGSFAYVYEPKDPSCDPKAKWRIRYRFFELSGEYAIEISFFRRSSGRAKIAISARDRSDFEKIRRELLGHDARLPTDRRLGQQFAERLMRAVPTKPIVVVSKPGFRDGAKGFVMPNRRYGTAQNRFTWDQEAVDPGFGDIKGDLAQYAEQVLKPALSSPFLGFAILIGLAAPLPSYVEQRTGGTRLLSEGAVFHWAGESSSGKTTLARVTQSVFGSPAVTMDYEATPRGVAEAAYSRNDLVVVLDDTENAGLADRELFTVMKTHAQRLAAGRSKAIARSAGKGAFPPLTWFTFGVSTGPETLADLARRLGRKRFGDQVRLLDMKLPPAAKGGIFATPITRAKEVADDPNEMIRKIEHGSTTNHGVLGDAWITHLLSADYSARVQELFDQFIKIATAGENGLETRFAGKFALMYAAGVVAVEAGLLPWPADWPLKAVLHCYRLARKSRDPNAGAVDAELMKIARALEKETLFVQHNAGMKKPPAFPKTALGLHIHRHGKVRWYIRSDVGIDDPALGRLVLDKARRLGFIIDSPNATSSVQFRVLQGSKAKKLRFWRLHRGRTLTWAANRTAGRRALARA